MFNIKAWISYLLLIGLAVLYTLFLEAPGGSYLIIALVSAGILSVLLCVYTSRKLTADIEIRGDVLNRNDIAAIDLVFTNDGFLPSSFINVELFSSYHFTTVSKQNLHTSVLGKSSLRFTAEYRAEFFGKGRIGISSISVTDHLGLISLRMRLPKAIEEVKVYPDIPEVNAREGLARSLTDAAAFDESEETTQSMFAVNGTPGYEHRKYEPGDSLKLINWKLSAKRGEYYVRRLEGASGAEQTFILDKAGSLNRNGLDRYREEQLTVEAMLALMMQFAKTELPSKLMIRFGNVWETIPVVTPSDVSDIRYRLTDYTFSDDAVGRTPVLMEGHTVIFTARCDGYIAGMVSGYENRSAASPHIGSGAENIWVITRDENDIRFTR
ncbi:MAG: DUF58 domain-containing protein [Ruminiclostridium sp.]|nr:DUF58 domain-containing protein [Ruminiclostridium sp.]